TITMKSGGRYFAAEALDSRGKVLGTSKAAKLNGPATAARIVPSPQERKLVTRLETGGTQPNFVAPRESPGHRGHVWYYVGGAILIAVIAAGGAAFGYRRRRAR
ncbi:MAG TPA: hypothetical protein VHW26_05700, partial [Solirubrobacteraceae bacterium]|nr:hypothetical protein [Solirubrobacteraceae bacterium]